MAKMPDSLAANRFLRENAPLANQLAHPHTSPSDLNPSLAGVRDNECLNESKSIEGMDWFDEFPSTMPCVIYECRSDRKVMRVSSNSSELLGIFPTRLIGNRSLFEDRLPETDRGALISRFEQLAPGKVTTLNHRIIDERGLYVWVAHSMRKVASSSGFFVRGTLIPISIDVCDAKIDAPTVGEFVHKLGNHFQLINLLLGSLRRVGKDLPELNQLQQSVDRTIEFTRSFATYSQGPSCRSEIELEELLADAVKSCIASFAEKNVALNNLLQRALTGIVIKGDPHFLELAFVSILQNALDATAPGGSVNIQANIFKIQSGLPASVEIIVCDTGSGMDQETLLQATVPFFTSRRERDGLGLSLAARIFELEGGALTVSSEELRGTVVTILLPIYTPAQGDD